MNPKLYLVFNTSISIIVRKRQKISKNIGCMKLTIDKHDDVYRKVHLIIVEHIIFKHK